MAKKNRGGITAPKEPNKTKGENFMSWKTDWYYLTGDLKVTVRGIDAEDTYRTFDFTCYVSNYINDYDRLTYLEDAARALANMRDYYQAEIIDIKKDKKTEKYR